VSTMLLENLGEDLRSQVLATRWLGFLLQYVDHENLKKLLDYYHRIGWISSEVKEKLINLAEGIKSGGSKNEWMLPHRVHLTSLLFIQRLSGENREGELAGLSTYIRDYIESPEEFLSV